MARVILIEAAPWSVADGAPAAVRLAGGGARGYVHRGHNDWQAGVVGMPRFTSEIGFDVAQGGFTGGAVPTTGAVGFAPADPATVAALASLHWADAPMTIRTGDDALAEPEWTVVLDALVAGIAVRGNAISFTISDLSRTLARPALTARFAGTGGVEGGADAKDRIKRRSWGRCWNVEGFLIDKPNNIYEFGDPAHPLAAFDAVKDRGRAAELISGLGWQGSAAATFAALQAATAPVGGGVIAPSIACVKWWTQPAGPLTADLRGSAYPGGGYVEALGDIAAAIVAERSTLGISGVAAVNAARPGPAGLHLGSESETAAQALDRLLLGASTAWVVEPEGVVRLSPIALADPVETVVAIDVEREAAYKPVTERLLGYQKNEREHSAAEISAVFQAADGSYADGTPIEDLKPAEPGADVTGGNTAAAITGQGALATRNDVAYGTQITGLPAPIQPGNITGGGFLDARQVQYWGGPLVQTLQPAQAGADVTASNTAAAITGQGALATQSNVGWSSQITGRPTPLVDGIVGGAYFDARYTQNPTDGYLLSQRWPAELGANVTETRTAAAITGQAAWATYGGLLPSNVAGQVQRLDTSGNLASLDNVVDRRITKTTRADGTTVITELLVITAIGTAAAIAGQGAGATANTLAQLDATAAARLESLGEGGPVVVGLNETLKKLVPAGRSVFVEAASVVNAGAVGSPDGTATIRIRWAPAGSLSYTELANGSAPVDAFNEAPVFASGTYTNSGSADLVIDFVADVTVAPGGAGGTIRTAESYLRG